MLIRNQNIILTLFAAIVVGFLVTMLANASTVATALKAANVVITTDRGKLTFDLHDPIQRKVFIAEFENDPAISGCFQRADYAEAFMRERDAGVPLESHLTSLRQRYESTKLEPEGAVSWHLYIDYERMVRDVHRHAGSNGKGGYRYTDPIEVWAREWKWCAIQ